MELAAGTLELHRQTGRYLVGFFGGSRKLAHITRTNAQGFKTALASGTLIQVSKRGKNLAVPTIELHVRNARTIFNRAVRDDLILYNPFDRLTASPFMPKAWHFVTLEEFGQLVEAAPNLEWRLMLCLARLAALCRGEILSLQWSDIDWAQNRIRIIAKDDWKPKARPRNRTVPMSGVLQQLLLDAFELAPDAREHVIAPARVIVRNISRDFGVICRRAGVVRYAKPLHTLRKSCITDWAGEHPQHVVSTWAGHSNVSTTGEYYLQVSEAEYERAAETETPRILAQLLAQLGKKRDFPTELSNADNTQVSAPQGLNEKAGERIRTADVQLGKLAFYH